MKLRVPGTIAEGVQRVIGVLLDDGVREVTGKSSGLVRRWGDPDDDCCHIPMFQAVRLDAACSMAGEGTPILDAYLTELGRAIEAKGGAPAHRPLPLPERLARVMAELGDVARAEMRAREDKKIDAVEHAAMLQQAREVQDQAEKLVKDLEATAPQLRRIFGGAA